MLVNLLIVKDAQKTTKSWFYGVNRVYLL